MRQRAALLASLILLSLPVLSRPVLAQEGGEDITLTVCWASWPPAELLRNLSMLN